MDVAWLEQHNITTLLLFCCRRNRCSRAWLEQHSITTVAYCRTAVGETDALGLWVGSNLSRLEKIALNQGGVNQPELAHTIA